VRDVAAALAAWNSFYVMIGSSAAALTGLMFVVISLVRTNGGTPSEGGIAAFSTPTVLHFSCALFIAAVMAAPFRAALPIAVLIGIAGLAGTVFCWRVAWRSARLDSYKPDADDWTWHVALPTLAYLALVAGAIMLVSGVDGALDAPAAGVTLLIFIGIHNAWDVVTFLALGKADDDPDDA